VKIVMMTNTYLPHVGGVARSVQRFTEELRKMGHRVLVVAPEFGDLPGDEEEVVRVPAVQNFNGSDFSVRLPAPGLITPILNRFRPDLIHSHHPFLLGDTALRVAAGRGLPLVFTHHTMYERYTHYVPGDSSTMKRFAVQMVTGYANLCDLVVAPSESIADVLKERGVRTRIEAVPTGVDTAAFAGADGAAARRRWKIPPDAAVVGHVGRLAPEKNLEFLARAMSRFVAGGEERRALIVGGGPSREQIAETFRAAGVADRLVFTGSLGGGALADAYAAMDVFAFASTSETQGMVLAEAMAVGVPVVAVDAPGAREVVRDGVNGRLLGREDLGEFVVALERVAAERPRLREGALETAEVFSQARCAAKLAGVYGELIEAETARDALGIDQSVWDSAVRLLETEWKLWSGRVTAAADAMEEPPGVGRGA
jgi:1,2-diacylglycerol 3-alpha-glucosyltransferase